jgi:hypothetical protein
MKFAESRNLGKSHGDAGYAAWLPSLFQKAPGQVVYLVFSPGMPMLALLSEAMSLCRWKSAGR